MMTDLWGVPISGD